MILKLREGHPTLKVNSGKQDGEFRGFKMARRNKPFRF